MQAQYKELNRREDRPTVIGYIVDNDDTVSTAVVRRGDGAESFLAYQ